MPNHNNFFISFINFINITKSYNNDLREVLCYFYYTLGEFRPVLTNL
ncbi:hypothetical protein HanXRQr2_Chr13g0596661 [Helianthus annuus]|uniref:Uncharacterized protein n=1 Tax=Helianthus annuus TaxID=4232 RepID=A0A9K3EJ36_HELAN|nr:hypothetical protein HanXRQr2_Chr13g0596661 [Helianthus annuus]KAJ0849931.1 hypothetical protein HanPSC8_Chr13g0574631 [Helianthus annuus]